MRGDHAANEGKACDCKGTIFYGKRFVSGKPGSGKTLKFADVMRGDHKEKAVSGTVKCNSATMGGDPAPFYYKQCFCQKSDPDEPHKCANEGKHCDCKGTVFYGKRYVLGKPGKGTELTFDEVSSGEHKEKVTSGRVRCSTDKMGGDPAPFYYKQCFCQEEPETGGPDPEPECALRSDTYNDQQIPANCPSSKFPVGQKFCVAGTTYTVTKSWDSTGGSTVNHDPKPGRGTIAKGTKITFGSCDQETKPETVGPNPEPAKDSTECALRADTYNSQQIPANCRSSKFPVGQKFCVAGTTYTVTKSRDSVGGSTVNHERKS